MANYPPPNMMYPNHYPSVAAAPPPPSLQQPTSPSYQTNSASSAQQTLTSNLPNHNHNYNNNINYSNKNNNINNNIVNSQYQPVQQPPSLPQQQQQQQPIQNNQYRPMVPNTSSNIQHHSIQSPVPQPPQMSPPQQQQPLSTAQQQQQYGGGRANHQQQQPQNQIDQLSNSMGSMVVNQGWNSLWQNDCVNLMTEKDIRTKAIQEERNKELAKQQQLQQRPQQANQHRDMSSEKDILRCTLKKIPGTASLLQKCRLPLGVVLHPFKDDKDIPVIQDSPIVRCRSCRTYINPFVRLLDQRRWQCNLCQRINEVPDEFIYDFQTRQHIDIMTRPELNYGSIEYVASVEYMVRPPQPATYLFVFECSASAVQLGYIRRFASAMMAELDNIPGDARTLIGFMAFDTKLHFFNLNEERPTHMVMPDIEDIFIPHADCLLVKLKARRKQIEDFLTNILPTFPFDSVSSSENVADLESALGPALQVAFKVMSPSGGRITLIQTSLPSAGNRAEGMTLSNREDPNNRTANSSNSTAALTPLLNPASDFFKKLALECSEHQIAVDLFNLAATYSDLATVGTISKFSGGSVQYYGCGGSPSSPMATNLMLDRFEEDMKHYLSRSIGFEAVMRLRSTRGISIHTFHGNFFVRSTDLIALPNVNPDSAYGIQMSISDDLKEYTQVCMQAALLYTSSTGERRIRVHTIALPIVTIISEVIANADHEAIISLLAKMGVDRSIQSSILDAREALINANVDIINTYRLVNSSQSAGIFTSASSRLVPLYSLALLKHTAFRIGISTRVDERVYAMEKMKSLPIKSLLLYIYPDLYPIHYQFDPDKSPPLPLQLTFANIERNGVYLLDTYDHIFIYICKSVNQQFLAEILNVTQWSQIPDEGDQSSTTAGAVLPGVPNAASSGQRNLQAPPPQLNGHGSAVLAQPYSDSHQQPSSLTSRNSKLQHNDSLNSTYSDYSVGTNDDQSNQLPLDQLNNHGGGGGGDQSPTNNDNSGYDSDPNNSELRNKSSCISLPLLDNLTSQQIHIFINNLIKDRPFKPNFHILREDSRLRYSFLQYMYDDRNESAFSYYEFLQHLQQHLDK